MLKIKDDLMKKIYRIELTKFELYILLELILCADEKGQASVYYKAIANEVGCCEATFYNALKSLEEYGFLEYEGNSIYKEEILVKIFGNNFEDGYKNYTDINNRFFVEKKYLKLKAGAVRVFLYLNFRVMKGKYSRDQGSDLHNKNKLNFNDSYETLSKKLGIKKRMLKVYFQELNEAKIINVGMKKIFFGKKHHDVITVNHSVLEKGKILITENNNTVEKVSHDLHVHFTNVIKNLCRRFKINTDELAINDSSIVCTQYRKKVEDNGKNIYNLLKDSILQLRLNERALNGKTVHYIVKLLLEKDYAESIIL